MSHELLLFILLITISHFITAENFASKVKSTSLDIIDSFNKFANKLKSFFRLNTNAFEDRRKKIRKAFHNFIQESFYDKRKPKPNATIVEELIQYSDSKIQTPQLIALHGYRPESHTVLTTDGFMLTLHRILPSLDKAIKIKNKLALLHHGLLGSSEDWILLGPNKAFPYLLSDAGYDVWLTNARGNKYSRAHASRIKDAPEFWDFSWHEIGLYDLSAVIDYIRDVTEGKCEIHFIGHSLGATALLVLLSSSPLYNKLLKSVTLLAPLGYMSHVKGPLRLLAEFYNLNGYDSLNFLGENEFMSVETFPQQVIEKYCVGDDRLCVNPLLLLANGGQEITDAVLNLNILDHVPAGGSTKTIMHYIQLVNSRDFRMFDLGSKNNLKKYVERTPPIYRLDSVTVPIAIFSCHRDWLSTGPDIVTLLRHLPNVIVHHIVQRDEFSHTDFEWASDAPELVYNLILDIFDKKSL